MKMNNKRNITGSVEGIMFTQDELKKVISEASKSYPDGKPPFGDEDRWMIIGYDFDKYSISVRNVEYHPTRESRNIFLGFVSMCVSIMNRVLIPDRDKIGLSFVYERRIRKIRLNGKEIRDFCPLWYKTPKRKRIYNGAATRIFLEPI